MLDEQKVDDLGLDNVKLAKTLGEILIAMAIHGLFLVLAGVILMFVEFCFRELHLPQSALIRFVKFCFEFALGAIVLGYLSVDVLITYKKLASSLSNRHLPKPTIIKAAVASRSEEAVELLSSNRESAK